MAKYLTAFCLFVIIASCQKDIGEELPDIPGISDCRITRMVQGTHDGQGDDTTFLFHYDASGRMDMITWISEGFPMDFNLTYDVAGNLIKVQNALEPTFLETTFKYDPSNRLKEIQYYRFDSTKHVFEYGSDTLPLRCKTFDLVNGVWEEGAVDEYTWQNGDLIKSDTYINGVYKWSDTYDYYDAMPSILGNLPLISINSIPFGYWFPYQFFNRHMPKSNHYQSGENYNWKYTVDSGKVVQAISWYTHNPSTDTSQLETRNIEYECK